MSSKVVLVHKGYSWYLPISLFIISFNCGPGVVLIGDFYARIIGRLIGISVFPLYDYEASASTFRQLYLHHSEHGIDFERFCIERWFILNSFAKRNGLSGLIHLDSDILVSRSFSSWVSCLVEPKFYFTGFSAHCAVINDVSILASFCDWITNFYSDCSNVARMENWHNICIEDSGSSGMSDMVLLKWFSEIHPDHFASFSCVSGFPVIDTSLCEADGFLLDSRDFKKIIWRSRRPYFLGHDSAEYECIALHHQGAAKKLIVDNAAHLGFPALITYPVLLILKISYKASYQIILRLYQLLDLASGQGLLANKLAFILSSW